MNLKRLTVSVGGVGLLVLLGVGSCNARYTDVSNEPDHADWVGQRCVVRNGLKAQGFTLDLRKRDVTSAVVVTTLPGFSGPEVTFTTLVPKGTTLIVTSVRKCWNCPFDRISYGVVIPDTPKLATHKVFARAEALAPQETQCTKNR